tara:strand:- start:239 stop:490 length:252 start_codon:yes stop_codon:yes gene_type:complete
MSIGFENITDEIIENISTEPVVVSEDDEMMCIEHEPEPEPELEPEPEPEPVIIKRKKKNKRKRKSKRRKKKLKEFIEEKYEKY